MYLYLERSLTVDYVYRNDSIENLLNIDDCCFRARRWIPSMWGHDVLKQKYNEMADSKRIFRICFWTQEYDATDFANTASFGADYWHQKWVTLRVSNTHSFFRGFNDTWDDAFSQGIVHLFWSAENLNEHNSLFSHVGIPLLDFDIRQNCQWISYNHSKLISPIGWA